MRTLTKVDSTIVDVAKAASFGWSALQGLSQPGLKQRSKGSTDVDALTAT